MKYDPGRFGSPEELLFFDIETTGLSAHSSQLYLIGAVYFREGSWHYRQWFSESLSEEENVLRSFFSFAGEFRVLISFNGDSFDLRYLTETAREYGLSCPLSGMDSVDLLRMLRKYRKLLNLPNLRQKSIEQFLGIGREDRYTGLELIEVYQSYGESRDTELLKLLLLHNEEDIRGMPDILPILTYPDAFTSDFELLPLSGPGESRTISIVLRYPFEFPKPLVYCPSDHVRLKFSGNTLELTLPCIYRELRYYYPDTRNYYYLPLEDTAIHKKLAAFVQPEFRKPATKETCYTRFRGHFLPSYKTCSLPKYRESYQDKISWVRLPEDPVELKHYIKEYLSALF